MRYYLVVHYEPSVPRETVETRWAELSEEKRAAWIRTWYNLDLGKRYCWWEVPNKEVLEQIFQEHQISWEKITEVRLTTPAEWASRED